MEKVINLKLSVTAEPTNGETDQEIADRILDEVTEALNDAYVPAYVELDDPAVVPEQDE